MLKSLLKPLIRRLGDKLPGVFSRDGFYDQQMLLSKNKVLTIFDVGAYIGDTVAKYRRLFPKSTIYGFEPFPESYENLRKRFKRDNSIKLLPMAVSDKAGRRRFYVNKYNPAHSLLPRAMSGRRYYPEDAVTIDEIEVTITTIDDYCREKTINEIQILKMDIQGGELMALQGATEKLAQSLISVVYVEIMLVPHYERGAMFHEISNFLSEYEYTLFNIYNTVNAKNGQLRFADAIFVSPQIRRNVIDRFDPEP